MLIGILATVGSNMMSDSFTTTRMVNAGNASAGEARYALERLAREIREVKYNVSAGYYCFINWTPSTNPSTTSSLRFYKRIAGSTEVSDCTAEVTPVGTAYFSDKQIVTLNYSSSAPANTDPVLINQVDTNGFTFDFYKSDGTALATGIADIGFVQITLKVKDATSGQLISQRTRVALRNF